MMSTSSPPQPNFSVKGEKVEQKLYQKHQEVYYNLPFQDRIFMIGKDHVLDIKLPKEIILYCGKKILLISIRFNKLGSFVSS